MTIIAGYIDPAGGVVIGGDRRLSRGSSIWGNTDKWVIGETRKWAVGFSGPAIQLPLLQALTKGWDELHIEDFGEKFHQFCKDKNWNTSGGTGSPPTRTGGILVATKSQLYELDSGTGFAIACSPGEFLADGSGCNYAMGAWTALGNFDLPPEQRMEKTILAAIANCETCGGIPQVFRLG